MKTGMNRYVLITNNLTWTQAQTLCRTNYTDLMSIQDQTEYDAVVNQTSADTWIGLHRHGWYWTNTTNTFPIDWAYDQPDNYNWDENCGAFLDGLASDESCTAIKPFVCSACELHNLLYTTCAIVSVTIQGLRPSNPTLEHLEGSIMFHLQKIHIIIQIQSLDSKSSGTVIQPSHDITSVP